MCMHASTLGDSPTRTRTHTHTDETDGTDAVYLSLDVSDPLLVQLRR